MSTDDLLFGDAFKASPEKALAALTSKYGKTAQAGEATTDARARRTRRRSGVADTTQMDTSPATRSTESGPAQNTSSAVPADVEQTASGDPAPTPQAEQPRRTSASIPEDVWHAVAHYCVTNSVSRIGLIMRALAKTNGRHRELVDQERSRDTTSAEDRAAMEMFGLTEAPMRRGGARPKKQMPYVVTPSVSAAIDRLVRESGAHNRGELFTAVLRSYLDVE